MGSMGELHPHTEGKLEEFCYVLYGRFAGDVLCPRRYPLSDTCFKHWFFWTWKIGPSSIDNSPRSPLWSYKLGLDNDWIPQNPRDAYVRLLVLYRLVFKLTPW
jgi:hypothetical protein